eukprot:682385-Rhodomonas_salina.4
MRHKTWQRVRETPREHSSAAHRVDGLCLHAPDTALHVLLSILTFSRSTLSTFKVRCLTLKCDFWGAAPAGGRDFPGRRSPR